MLDGEPMSAHRFRHILNSVRPTYFAGRQSGERSTLKSGRGSCPTFACLLDAPVYHQLVLATQLVSRDRAEHEHLTAQLEKGLAGIRTLERLLNAAFPSNTALTVEQSAHIAKIHLYALARELPGLEPWQPGGVEGFIPEPPPIEEFIPEIDLGEIIRQQCLPITDFITITGTPDSDGNYVIESISPASAPAGSSLTISGSGFGPSVSSILFPRCGGGVIRVPPRTASETDLTVTVPDHTTSGPVALQIPWGAIRFCNRVMPVFELGEPGYFEAATPCIDYFRVTARTAEYALPGSTVPIEWQVCPPDAQVELRVQGGSWETVGNLESRDFAAPLTNVEELITLELRATKSTVSTTASLQIHVVGALPTIKIVDVEFTQGIQTMFRADGTPNNSVALVADKDTIVRVYIDVDRKGFNNDYIHVGGRLGLSSPEVDLTPVNSPDVFIYKGKFARSDRVRTNGTLNFRIPAYLCNRTLDLEIDVIADWPGETKPVDSRRENICFRKVPAMLVRVRRIEGNAGNSPASDTAFRNVLNAFNYLPSPTTDIVVLPGTHQVSWYIADVGGYDTDTGVWLLSQELSAEHWGPNGLFFDGAIWVGLTYHWNRGIMAWPDFWTCISRASDTAERTFETTAHEICHCLGFGHVRNGGESCNDLGLFNTTCEPARYEGPLADIAFNVRNNEAVYIVGDLMSYVGGARFLNPEFWIRAMNEIEARWGNQ